MSLYLSLPMRFSHCDFGGKFCEQIFYSEWNEVHIVEGRLEHPSRIAGVTYTLPEQVEVIFTTVLLQHSYLSKDSSQPPT